MNLVQKGALAAALLVALGAASAPQLTATAAPAAETQSPPLVGKRIVLSNDDSMQAARENGKDGIGLYDIRHTLCAAGADVVVVAPWQYMSGAGGAVTNSGQLTAQRRTALPAGYESDCATAPSGGAVFGLCRDAAPCTTTSLSATPADTIKFALHDGLTALVGWEGDPDLVVTGINSGPNVSASINDSGTVGAAIAGIDNGVPAVAFSGHVDAASDLVTRQTYEAEAEFGAELIAQLFKKRLLTSDYVINVNYPDVTDGHDPGRPRWTRVGLGTFGVHTYTAAPGTSTFSIGWAVCPAPHCEEETRADADSTALFAGRISIGALTRDRTLLLNDANRLRSQVRSGKLFW